MVDLSNPIYTDDEAARKHLEAIRWPNGAYCPHCGEAENVKPLQGKSHRPGLHKCYSCLGHFSVTVGTVFERSKVPLHKWIHAAHLMAASKKGISAHQIHRMLGVTYKTAWFMEHRLREAMREKSPSKMGGGGKYVEVDETYIIKNKPRHGRKLSIFDMEKVITLVERDGSARSFHVNSVNSNTIRKILREQINSDSAIMTDEAPFYKKPVGEFFAGHGSVNHSIHEYVRGSAHTNTIEGFFSILKRGMNGVYQHCSKEHLKRYLAEYDFRYTYREKLGYDDEQRAELLLKGIGGKRLMYN